MPKKKITFNKKNIVNEHRKLVKLLSTTAMKLNKESKEQKSELKKYIKKK